MLYFTFFLTYSPFLHQHKKLTNTHKRKDTQIQLQGEAFSD